MRSKYLLWILALIFEFGAVYPVQAQKSLNYSSDSEIWQSAMQNFHLKNYGAARHEFQDFLKSDSGQFSDREGIAKFYMAYCSIELFRPSAEKEMNNFIHDYPESNKIQSAYFQLGRLQYRNKKYKSALSWFTKLDPYRLSPEELTEYRFKMGYSYFAQEDYEKARKNFYEIIEVSGDYNAPANYYYAHIAYLKKNYETARVAFEKLADNKTFAPIVPYYICQIYYLQEKYKELLSYAPPYLEDASVKRQPEIAKMIGLAHYQQKQYQQAIPFLKRGEESLTRDDRFAYGYCLYQQKQFEAAIGQFEKIGGDEDELLQVATYCLADCYLQTGNKNGAKAAFASTARMNFDKNMQQDALFNFAKLSYELSYSPFNETIKAFDEYLQKYPNSNRNDEAYDYLVKVYMTTKNYAEALSSMDKIKNKTPEIERAYQRVSWLRGLELMKQLKYEEAIQAFDLSWKYSKYNAQIAADRIYWKAEANYRLGKLDDAISQFKTFLTTPGAGTSKYFHLANYNIAYAEFDQERYELASDWFRKFVNQTEEKDEFYSDACNRIADCFFVNREYAQAADFYAKAQLQASWGKDYALYQQAFCLGLLNQPNRKIELLKALNREFPKSDYTDDALYELARAQVKLENQREAIDLYKDLAERFPNSSYAAKSLLQLGLMNYNQKDYQEAIRYYKMVVSKYPQSEESRSAFLGLKNVYVDLNRVDDYFAYAESANSGMSIRSSEKDSLSYLSAERLYMLGESQQGSLALQNYLNNFPNGRFRVNAQYYRADAALNQGNYDEALSELEQVLNQPNNLFTERALLAASQLNFKKKDFEQAKKQFQRLIVVAEIPANADVAKLGLMRSLYELQEYNDCIQAADQVLTGKGNQEEIVREARYKRAKSNWNLGRKDKAAADWKILAKEVQSREGAEAKFRMAEQLFNQSKFDAAEKEINEFIEMNSPHHYWLAESFLLLSDVFLKKDDAFQAKYTLQSIVDNYDATNDGILEKAQQKLNLILQAEKSKEQQIQKKQDEIRFEGTDSLQNEKLFQDQPSKKKLRNQDENREMLQEMLENEKEVE